MSNDRDTARTERTAGQKRSHGALWFVGWLLLIYLISFPFAVAITMSLSKRGQLPMSVQAILSMIYAPIIFLISSLGLDGPYMEFIEWISRVTP